MTYFLSNDSLWSELRDRVKTCSRVKAAVAFLGNGGADLLPLKKGDTLVVNLGLQTVRQGATSPKEIQRLIKRGVKVFTRSNLHAKFFICGKSLLVGSANVSKNSQNLLDEAATITSEGAAIRRATGFFEKLCTEPVRPDYLKLCLRTYRPPRFIQNRGQRKNKRQKRIAEAKLWLIGGLVYKDMPKYQQELADKIVNKASKKLKNPQKTFVDCSHFSNRPKFLKKIRPGDWFVTCVLDKTNGKREVNCPEQVMSLDNIPAKKGKRTYILLSEALLRGQAIPLARFRKKIRRILPRLDKDSPLTTPIINNNSADFILNLWTASGREKK